MKYREPLDRNKRKGNFEAPETKKIVDTIISWARSGCEKLFPPKSSEIESPEEKERQAFEASRFAEYGGVLALLRNDKEDAADAYRKAVELYPENELAWRILSYILDDLGKTQEARAARSKT